MDNRAKDEHTEMGHGLAGWRGSKDGKREIEFYIVGEANQSSSQLEGN